MKPIWPLSTKWSAQDRLRVIAATLPGLSEESSATLEQYRDDFENLVAHHEAHAATGVPRPDYPG